MFLFVCVVNGAKVQQKSDIHKDSTQKNAKRVDFPPRSHPENRKSASKRMQIYRKSVFEDKIGQKSDGKSNK